MIDCVYRILMELPSLKRSETLLDRKEPENGQLFQLLIKECL